MLPYYSQLKKPLYLLRIARAFDVATILCRQGIKPVYFHSTVEIKHQHILHTGKTSCPLQLNK